MFVRRGPLALMFALWVAMAIAGCRTPRTQLLVVIALDPNAPPSDRIGSVAVTLRSSAQPETPRLDRVFEIGQSSGQVAFPFSFGVYPENEAVERRVDIVVDACGTQGCIGRPGGTRAPLVVVHANAGFVRGETRVLTLRLSQRCVGVTCGASQTCDPDRGVCVDANVDPTTLPIDGADAGADADANAAGQVVQVAAGGGLTCFRMTDGSVRCAGGSDSLVSYSNVLGVRTSSAAERVPGVDDAVDLAVGYGFACAIERARTVRCWGGNAYGQLGFTGASSPSATDVPGLHDVAQISLGGFFGCARLLDGTVACWGLNAQGELGDGTRTPLPRPRRVEALTDVVEIAAGGFHACARLASGAVQCWGARLSPAIGDGTPSGASSEPTVPVSVIGLEDATQITAGGLHTCARRANGQVACWGAISFAQTGAGFGMTTTPTTVADLDRVVEVRAGAYHTCARIENGSVKCWGRNDRGQLGDGTRETRRTPVSVVGLGDAIAISIGSEHSCAQRADRSTVCWGDDSTGQLASGRPLAQPTPTDAVELDGVDRVSAGALHSCAIRDQGAWCWGMTVGAGTVDGIVEHVQDGPRTSDTRPSPVVHLAPPPDQVAVGNDFACTHMVDGTVRCWGHNNVGQLGSGTVDAVTAVEVDGLVNTAEVRAGFDFGCARGVDGTVSCWGNNATGELGISRITQTSTRPVLVPGISTATHLSAHDSHACVRTNDGHVSCWGANGTGEVGSPALAGQFVDTPTVAWGLEGAIDVGTAQWSSFARTTDGPMFAWGWNGLGLLSTAPSIVNVFAPTLSRHRDVASFATGAECGCVVSTAGELSCLGLNVFGECGDGTRFASIEPQHVTVGSGIGMRVSQVSMADVSTCAIAEGEVYCWGDNTFGTVGDNSGTMQLRPVRVAGLTDVRSMASAVNQHCALTGSHQVSCWGTNLYGSLGNEERNDPSTPVDVEGLEGLQIAAVSTGWVSACALDTSRGVWCWGANDSGELGTGTFDPRVGAARVHMPAEVTTVDAIAVSARFACALANGSVYCWGSNDYGQLGDGTDRPSASPLRVPGILDAIDLVALETSVCIRRTDGRVWCWGGNGYGQLGSGTIAPLSMPAPVSGLDNVTAIAGSGSTMCAIHGARTVSCWGSNTNAQLGTNGPTTAYSTVPVEVPVRGVNRIVAGGLHICALQDVGGVQCWGSNGWNQISPGPQSTIRMPIDVTQASGADDLALGFAHTCVLRGGIVSCWGRNVGHELGGASDTLSVAPREIDRSRIADAVHIVSSYTFSCAIRASGGVSCWGSNELGMLGGHTRAAALAPVRVRTFESDAFGVADVSAGAGYSCARLGGAAESNHPVRCWGSNFSEQLGETTGPDHAVPTANANVGNLPDVVRVSTGPSHACVVTANGSGYCWGNNSSGQLGDGAFGLIETANPVPVPRAPLVDIAAGGAHTCAVAMNGTVFCWGANDKGQVGIAASPLEGVTQVPGVRGIEHVVAGGAHNCAWSHAGVWCWGNGAPVHSIDGLTNVTRVVAGTDVLCDLAPGSFIGCSPTNADHTCALADGQVWCWGTNAHGELGDGTFVDSARPVPVRGLSEVTDIAVGGRHSCARRSDGHVVCWGSDSYGQLGTGRESWVALPAPARATP